MSKREHNGTVCVFGASNPKLDARLHAGIREMALCLASNGLDLLTGGGKHGVMGLVTDVFLAQGRKVTGIAPQFMVDKGWMHEGLTELIATADMAERKKLMVAKSSAFILAPGGYGTLDEFFEVLTLKQLGAHDKPVAAFSPLDYYAHLFRFIGHAQSLHGIHGDMTGLFFESTNGSDVARHIIHELERGTPHP